MANPSLTMTFLTETGTKSNLTLNNVKPALTQAEAGTLMDVIIAKNILFTDGGDLKTKSAAQLVERTVTKLTV